jgi:hypothetical protein
MLPNRAFYGLWESLHFKSSLKSDLMNYAETSFLLSQKEVSNTLISWNKVILFHGPSVSLFFWKTGVFYRSQLAYFCLKKQNFFSGICAETRDSPNWRLPEHGVN